MAQAVPLQRLRHGRRLSPFQTGGTMPTIISRVYADKKTAEAARAALAAAGYSASAYSGTGTSIPAKGLGSKGVAAGAAALKAGHALLLADAGFGRARKAAAIADGFSPVAVEGIGRDLYVMENADAVNSEQIQRNKRYATTLRDVQGHRRVSSLFGWNTLSSKNRSGSVYSGTVRFGAFLFPLLSKKSGSRSAWSGTNRMGAFLLPLLSSRR
jgi:hypothetical protein